MSAQKKDLAQSSGRETVGKINPTVAPTVDSAALALVTGQVRNLLAFHQEMGLTAYPAAPALHQFLTRVRVQKPQPRPQSIPQQTPAFGEQGRGQQGFSGPTTQQQGRQQQGRQLGNQPEKPARPHRPPEQKNARTT
ncbi:MAG: hypothetical protein D3925_13625, partial [Candidatus Electrothrix sp. AR5]|nr:hypothetical protein [Candidatus Electrothrix sp. AR5]